MPTHIRAFFKRLKNCKIKGEEYVGWGLVKKTEPVPDIYQWTHFLWGNTYKGVGTAYKPDTGRKATRRLAMAGSLYHHIAGGTKAEVVLPGLEARGHHWVWIVTAQIPKGRGYPLGPRTIKGEALPWQLVYIGERVTTQKEAKKYSGFSLLPTFKSPTSTSHWLHPTRSQFEWDPGKCSLQSLLPEIQ